MKTWLFFLLFFAATGTQAQQYALLDMHLANPIQYANTITPGNKFNDLFPVEKKMLPQFIKVLEEIEKKLSSKEPFGEAKQFEIGCINFRGIIVSLASGERLDYVVTSTCDNIGISMHLCDAKISNTSNAFFIKTWIKYMEGYAK
ncbi:MAG: hypothetical protein ABI472_07425 [Ginsengibacter sp.]